MRQRPENARRNRRLAALAGVVLALALSVSLLRPAHNHIVTHRDGTVTQDIAGEPVVTAYTEVTDFACIEGFPCPDRAMADVRGLYPRDGVPVLAAVLGGLTLPFLLVAAAIAVTAWRRWMTVLMLCASALILCLCLVSVTMRYSQRHADGRVEPADFSPPIFVTKVEAGTDDCMDPSPCRKGTYAFTTGVFPTHGVPAALAIAGGMAAPILLLGAALAAGVRRRRVASAP